MFFPASRLVTVTALLVTVLAAPALADSTGSSTSEGFTRSFRDDKATVLPQPQRGRAALNALGDRLPGVAARNGLSTARLTEILTDDSTAWLSSEGQMFYREQVPPAEQSQADAATPQEATAQAATAAAAGSSTVPAYPVNQTFTLHSRPSATRTIYLDFNGHDLVNSAWSTGGMTMASAAYTGYDSDGNVSSFSTAEHAWMQEVWRQVAEAYAPFDVDVTTADGGLASRTRSSYADTTYGTQVLFTNSAQAVAQACNSACLGIAWVGTFDSLDPVGAYQPAWVFTKTTMSATIAAQGASHEAGHTLGLQHDGIDDGALNKQPYYAGTQAWGPIMGSAYSRAVSQFSKGEYANASNREDDFAVIAANGLAVRTDDHGSTTGTAYLLGAATSYAVSGVISTRSDVDVFGIDLRCTTDLTVTATGVGPQTTLDLKLEVLDGSGAVVATSSPTSGYAGRPPVSNGMDASVQVPGAIGTYYLRVDGVGTGNPATTGWSDYASLGQYKVTANGCANVALQPPSSTASPSAAPSASPTPVPGEGSTPSPTPSSPSTSPAPAATRPTAPRIGTASPGAKGGKVTAIARWAAPAKNGGAAITKYRVVARKLDAKGRTVRTFTSAFQKPTVRTFTWQLPKGRYTFVVTAWNRVGASPQSSPSRAVTAR